MQHIFGDMSTNITLFEHIETSLQCITGVFISYSYGCLNAIFDKQYLSNKDTYNKSKCRI